jgi:DNA-binding transcriptional LysR family regulator
MNTRQLEAFRAIARLGTVTAAAEALHASQPAVSRLLSRLEQQLALQLFTRDRGRLRLTPEGSALLTEVDRHFTGLDAVDLAARRIAEHGPGSLRVIAFPSLSSGVLPNAISGHLADHPGTAITLDTETTDRIVARVESGAYDIGFTAGSIGDHRSGEQYAVETQHIDSRKWICVFAKTHRLAKRRHVSLQDLAGEQLIGFSAGMSLRSHIDKLFNDGGIQANFALSAQTIESICALVEAGCGSAIIHPYAIHVAQLRGLTAVPLNHNARLDLVAVTPPAHSRAKITDVFVDRVKSLAASESLKGSKRSKR